MSFLSIHVHANHMQEDVIKSGLCLLIIWHVYIDFMTDATAVKIGAWIGNNVC